MCIKRDWLGRETIISGKPQLPSIIKGVSCSIEGRGPSMRCRVYVPPSFLVQVAGHDDSHTEKPFETRRPASEQSIKTEDPSSKVRAVTCLLAVLTHSRVHSTSIYHEPGTGSPWKPISGNGPCALELPTVYQARPLHPRGHKPVWWHTRGVLREHWGPRPRFSQGRGRRSRRRTTAFLEEVLPALDWKARFGTRLVFESWFCHLLAAWLWVNYITSLNLNFVSKNRLKIKWDNTCEVLITVPETWNVLQNW